MKLRLSPTLFLILESLILLPSLLFALGILMWVFFKNPGMYYAVISRNTLQNIGVMIISPSAGGFFAYQYLERYKPKGFARFKARGIIVYSIFVLGLTSAYFLLGQFGR